MKLEDFLNRLYELRAQNLRNIETIDLILSRVQSTAVIDLNARRPPRRRAEHSPQR